MRVWMLEEAAEMKEAGGFERFRGESSGGGEEAKSPALVRREEGELSVWWRGEILGCHQ